MITAEKERGHRAMYVNSFAARATGLSLHKLLVTILDICNANRHHSFLKMQYK